MTILDQIRVARLSSEEKWYVVLEVIPARSEVLILSNGTKVQALLCEQKFGEEARQIANSLRHESSKNSLSQDLALYFNCRVPVHPHLHITELKGIEEILADHGVAE